MRRRCARFVPPRPPPSAPPDFREEEELPHIVLLPGDGIGPEVTAEAVKCLGLLSDACELDLVFEVHEIGGAAIDAGGDPMPPATLAACERADAILLGAVGGPQWDG